MGSMDKSCVLPRNIFYNDVCLHTPCSVYARIGGGANPIQFHMLFMWEFFLQ